MFILLCVFPADFFQVCRTPVIAFSCLILAFFVGRTPSFGRFFKVFCGSAVFEEGTLAFAAPVAGRAGVAAPILMVENVLTAGLTAATSVALRPACSQRGGRVSACAGGAAADRRRPPELKSVLLAPCFIGAIKPLVVLPVFGVATA